MYSSITATLFMALPNLKCEVCQKPAIGVCNALGPVSCAFCRECIEAHRFPYWNLVGYLGFPPPKAKEDLAEWVHPAIDATLAFYKKTWEEFVSDCQKANDKYEEEEDDRCPTCRSAFGGPHEEGCPEAPEETDEDKANRVLDP